MRKKGGKPLNKNGVVVKGHWAAKRRLWRVTLSCAQHKRNASISTTRKNGGT